MISAGFGYVGKCCPSIVDHEEAQLGVEACLTELGLISSLPLLAAMYSLHTNSRHCSTSHFLRSVVCCGVWSGLDVAA